MFGSSLTSAFWNGAATYYRGIYKSLHDLGYHITFAEPDIFGRLQHRDHSPAYATCPIYHNRSQLQTLLREAQSADWIVKHSGIGAEDRYLEAAVLECAANSTATARPRVIFWDVDAPATLAELETERGHPLRALLPAYDFVFTYGGGPPVLRRYLQLGARACFPIYNGLDPDTHFPVPARPLWRSDVVFLGHRLPDREDRVRHFFFGAAAAAPAAQFVLAGEGWDGLPLPRNVRCLGFVPPAEHNALNSSARFVLNLNRNSMARVGFSPPTRIFEAAGASAAVITDTWPGISLFFEPGREILLAAGPADIAVHLTSVSTADAAVMGARARARALAEHTYARRAQRVHELLSAAPHSRAAQP